MTRRAGCEICEAIARDGWNSTDWFHCRCCHARWQGVNKAHCNVCHETFSTPKAADAHWTQRGHVPAAEVRALEWNPERSCWQRKAPQKAAIPAGVAK
jgi:hypothetical protein